MFDIPHLDLPALGAVSGTLRLPGSKSLSNRALLLAAFAEGCTTLRGLLASDDTRVMLDALRQLGCGVEERGSATVTIDGLGGAGSALRMPSADFFLGNAGTAMRPLTAALAVLGGDYTLRGIPRMHERPIGDLVDALRSLGCSVDYLGRPGFPPLHIGQGALRLDAPIRVRGNVSSQFLTALLMALPLAADEQGITIEVDGPLISTPYVGITLSLLARFGVAVQRHGWERFDIPAGSRLRSPGELVIEPDASSASYFIAATTLSIMAASGKCLEIEGLGTDSVQGDIRFIDAARQMGADIEGGAGWLRVRPARLPLRAIELDCTPIPDAAMTLAMLALYADGVSTLRGIASWRVKETDRIAAVAAELRRLGAAVEAGDDFMRITPPALADGWRAVCLHTYDDHRMAMCASLAAFNPAGLPVRIENPACVAKTFPDYFETLFALAAPAATTAPVICIDGPSASGKGTLASLLAQRLGWHYLDSGALYRAAARAARRAGLLDSAAPDAAAIGALTQRLDVRFEGGSVWLDGEDASDAIRSEQAGMDASLVAAIPAVRAALLDRQRACAVLPGLVADGRDMGSVVFPAAPLKIFLTASAQQRALRRLRQLQQRGVAANLAALCADLQARDARDASRAAAPMQAAQDAVPLDNSQLTPEQSVQQALALWHSRQPFAPCG